MLFYCGAILFSVADDNYTGSGMGGSERLRNSGDCEATQTQAQTHAYKHTITHALYTRVHTDFVL
jgi:hypothetical protein